MNFIKRIFAKKIKPILLVRMNSTWSHDHCMKKTSEISKNVEGSYFVISVYNTKPIVEIEVHNIAHSNNMKIEGLKKLINESPNKIIHEEGGF